jgi:glutamate-1-semialdehyde 2,1-aminomutase
MKAQALKWPDRAPQAASPSQTGRGALVYSDDGRPLIDFHNAAGAVLLGHADPDVEAVATAPGGDSLRLRAGVAEALLSLMPLAQAVYLFNSLHAARRTALDVVRNASGRDRVLTCYAGKTGPDAIAYGDLEALERALAASSVAAVVVEPVGLAPPCPAYLAGLREVADRHRAFLVFDETLSAFRVHEGGAQTLFNVRPDLTLIGESLANGRPIAALTGDPILLATAAPGSAPGPGSLAAAAAVLAKVADEPVTTSLAVCGAEVQAELAARIRAHGGEDVIAVAGDPTMSALVFADGCDQLAELCVRELEAHGVRRPDRHFISHAHGEREIARLLEAYDQILPVLVRAAAGEEGVVRLHRKRLEREFAAK